MKPQQKSISFEAALNKDADRVGRVNKRIDRRANGTNKLAIFGLVSQNNNHAHSNTCEKTIIKLHYFRI